MVWLSLVSYTLPPPSRSRRPPSGGWAGSAAAVYERQTAAVRQHAAELQGRLGRLRALLADADAAILTVTAEKVPPRGDPLTPRNLGARDGRHGFLSPPSVPIAWILGVLIARSAPVGGGGLDALTAGFTSRLVCRSSAVRRWPAGWSPSSSASPRAYPPPSPPPPCGSPTGTCPLCSSV